MLRGPDPEAFRTKVYGARWYVDPLPACDIAPATKDKWPSVSTVKKAWSKPFRKKLPTGETVPLDALWTAEFIADNLAAVEALKGDRAAVVTLCATASARRLNAAANRGTGVHTLLEDIAGGVVVDDSLLDVAVEPFAPACRQFISDWAPTWVATEVIAYNREIGYAGTADAIVSIALDGKPWVVLTDYKTRSGAHGAYEEEIAQIGGYSLAEYIVVRSPVDGTPMRMELPKLDGGLIVSIGADGYQPYPVDLDEAQAAFRAMHASWLAHRGGQKAARKARQHPLIVPPSNKELGEQLEASVEMVTTNIVPEPPSANGDLHAARLEWLRARILKIIEHSPEAAQALAREWSTHDHIPTMKAGGPRDAAEIETVVESCWAVEKAFGLPFPDEEPGVAAFAIEAERQGLIDPQNQPNTKE